MVTIKRQRRIHSVQNELLRKSREAALAAVQIFNNPQILFKSELFIVTIIIAWTYLLHAYYRKHSIDYRYFRENGRRKSYDRTKGGAYKYWELERCLNDDSSPVDSLVAQNLRFLIGLRHEIEHQMTTRIDSSLSAKFQACCINYNNDIKTFFGEKFGIDQHLAFSLQFSAISHEQKDILSDKSLPRNISAFIEDFESQLSEIDYNSPRFAYRLIFVPKLANRKGQADEVIEFVKADSELAQEVNKTYAVIKETEKPKYLPSEIVKIMKREGFIWFSISMHTDLWQSSTAKDPAKGFGTQIAKTWYWYDSWVTKVREWCLLHQQERNNKV